VRGYVGDPNEQCHRAAWDPDGAILVQSRFTTIKNRRFQALHFGPMSVSNQNDRLFRSQRFRWFALPSPGLLAPMGNMDISSSQLQLTSVLMAIEKMEQWTIHGLISPKQCVANIARTIQAETGTLYKDGYPDPADLGPDDADPLVSACKTMTTRVGYGSAVREVVRDQAKE
jgi:hypothetical protein